MVLKIYKRINWEKNKAKRVEKKPVKRDNSNDFFIPGIKNKSLKKLNEK